MDTKRLLLLAAQHAPCIDGGQYEAAEKIEREFEALLTKFISEQVSLALNGIVQYGSNKWNRESPYNSSAS